MGIFLAGSFLLGEIDGLASWLGWVGTSPSSIRDAVEIRWDCRRITRRRHGLQSSDDCILCGQHPETLDHLLLRCVYSRQLWFDVQRRLNLLQSVSLRQGDIFFWWLMREKVYPQSGKARLWLFLLPPGLVNLERAQRTDLWRTQHHASYTRCLLRHLVQEVCLLHQVLALRRKMLLCNRKLLDSETVLKHVGLVILRISTSS